MIDMMPTAMHDRGASMRSIRWPLASMAIFGGISVLALAVFTLAVMLGVIEPNREGAAVYWICAFAIILFGGAWLLLVVWTFVDAERRGMNAPLWAFLVFVLWPPLGPIIYLVFRSSSPDSNVGSSADSST
jgi:hypothetical protein